ncbi:hypothetical protein F3I27_20020 [Pantoea sp. Bo_2]|nr:hypothetical protein F3I34_19690 [Pantoea sp. Bo_5]KAA6055176.1 hypothetical protein F3I33_19500 [Pantoea sp. Bo_46]KAA6069045.1 hypothetical protein F3I28_20025 [Pantoea sp. Bo_21]KAA6069696.1 hypothetical protein F3I27_20020 [Pantoea sp. Bo_2]KAA6080793.1 hypothetical protein F3I30_20015 [Pantoea sp. Bo_34a]KAA6091434.1 hypothetical protein F3I26_23120 [Pantoea sp. Bo_19]KAA6117743.1 hypothetical protein F3I19_20020 [Pantoea sp. B_2]
MANMLAVLFLLLVAWICIATAREPLHDEKVSVMYGYPLYKKTWLTIYHYRATDRWVFEWDDLFDAGRPKSWGNISECLMCTDKKSGATDEEFKEAWKRLKKRGMA